MFSVQIFGKRAFYCVEFVFVGGGVQCVWEVRGWHVVSPGEGTTVHSDAEKWSQPNSGGQCITSIKFTDTQQRGNKGRHSHILTMNIFELKSCTFNREIFAPVLCAPFPLIACGKI